MRMHYIRPVLLAVAILFSSLAASPARAQVVISVGIAPPELPVYVQPVCPGDGYIWTPGYWAWDGTEYYWVPGTWVEAPQPGFFWTPPYWGWGGSAFIFHEGYWGPHVGFYGGINYGFGYFGVGFEGGRWEGGHFFYNRAVTNVNVTVIHNVYETRVDERTVTRVSYNGGRGGIEARPTREDESYDRERHVGPVEAQQRHSEEARSNREMRASVNHGAPPIAATPRPGAFNDRSAVPAHGGETRGGETNNTRSENTSGHTNTVVHAKDLQPVERHPAQPTGNTKVDQKYQKQQQQLSARQDQERQKLQQKQEQEHQQYTQQKATEARNQQLEQKHQQQTQQLQQHHAQQQQHLEQRQQPSHPASAPKEKR